MLSGADASSRATYTDANAGRSFLFFKKKSAKKTASAESQANDTVPASLKAYKSIVTDSATVKKGMFSVIHNGDNYYFEIPDSLLGRDMLIVNKLLRVPSEFNDAGINRGINTSNQMIRMELDSKGKRVIIRQARVKPIVPPTDAIALSVADNYIDPIIAALPIEARNADSTAVVIKVNDFYNGSKPTFGDVFNETNIGSSPISDLSRIVDIKAFDNNVYAVSELTTRVTEGYNSVNLTVQVGSSLVLLPEHPMTPRFDSSRVGYFSQSNTVYADSQHRVSHRNIITRWRLEPRPEDEADYLAGRLVEPRKPIVFYLDRSTPRPWRPYIKKGILDWQKAFETAGFRNAIQVKELADGETADDNDINYSVLTYAASKKGNAMGPSIVDPRSGEIIEADIIWWHNVVDIIRDWLVVQTGGADIRVREPQIPDSILGDAMRFVACHEVGHSLGLRHNMMASAAIPTDSLRSPSFTGWLGGTSASIMDYARFNYVAQPGDGVTVLSPAIGPYDIMAIEYGYRWYPHRDPVAETPMLQTLLAAYDHPLYAFCEPAAGRDQVDPRALSEDLGNDNIKAAAYGVANLRRIAPRILDWTTTGEVGQNYDEAANLLASVLGQWNLFMNHVMANVGGIYVDHTTVGDGRITYRYVEKDRQRRAVKFLVDEAFTYPSWLVDSPITDYTFLVQHTPVGRIEVSPSLMMSTFQSYFFWDLLNNDRLVRMLENEARNGNDAFTAIEMTDMLHKGIFRTTLAGRNPNVRERAVQKSYIDALIIAACEKQGVKDGVALRSDADDRAASLRETAAIINGLYADRSLCCGGSHAHLASPSAPEQSTISFHRVYGGPAGEQSSAPRTLNFYSTQSNRVSDAISIKRGELMRVRSLLKSRRATTSDTATRFHYDDLLMRINTALGLPLS